MGAVSPFFEEAQMSIFDKTLVTLLWVTIAIEAAGVVVILTP